MFLLGYPTISFRCPSIGEKFIIFSWEKNQFLKQWYNSGSFPIGLQMSLQLPVFVGDGVRSSLDQAEGDSDAITG